MEERYTGNVLPAINRATTGERFDVVTAAESLRTFFVEPDSGKEEE